ncbi:hypothetical protein [Paraburkholderia graminis]|uniref:hypothetical protein n=1 Tax=Paraburkholderia graminis TaxID=60548 RepID=UPI0038B8E0B4
MLKIFSPKSTAERLAKVETLLTTTGLLDELERKAAVANDQQRASLARDLAGLPDPSKVLAAVGKAERAAHAEYELAREAYQKAIDAWSRAVSASYGASYGVDSARNRLIQALEKSAPPELHAALADLDTLDQCLRACVGIVAMEKRYGSPGYDAINNVDAVSTARAAVAETAGEIRAMLVDGRADSATLIARAEAAMVEIGKAVSGFVSENLWNQRHSKSPLDMIRETAAVI